MKVFAFRYSSCIHEEGMVTIEGYVEFHAFGQHKHWDVKEIEVQNN